MRKKETAKRRKNVEEKEKAKRSLEKKRSKRKTVTRVCFDDQTSAMEVKEGNRISCTLVEKNVDDLVEKNVDDLV